MTCNLIHGDSAVVLKTLPDDCIDLTVTSPPYDNLRSYKGYVFDFESIARELFRVTIQGGVVVWIVSDETVNGSETGSSFRQALYFMNCGFKLHDTMIWNKGGFSAVGSLSVRYAPVFEYMFVFSKGAPKTFNPIKDRPNKSSGRTITGTIRNQDGSTKKMSSSGKIVGEHGQRFNIWDIPAEMRRKKESHPAPFPESIAKDHILTWSNPRDTVLDPFLGSGTSGKVAIDLGRDFIGIEISDEYLLMAKERCLPSMCKPEQDPILSAKMIKTDSANSQMPIEWGEYFDHKHLTDKATSP